MKKILIVAVCILFVPVLSGGLYITSLHLTGNFHEVVPGELYRSAQFSAKELTVYQKRYGIRSVLNLRGAHKGVSWYDQEIAGSSKDGIKHFNFKMTSDQRLNDKQIKSLLDIMADAPKPLLIHCHTGANRTGLASALYLDVIKDTDRFIAKLQLSPIYGHFPFWFIKEYAMDETYNAFESMIMPDDVTEEIILSGYI